jgi:Tfp pilus assembly protein PilV
MAGRKLKDNSRVPASTIIETVVAMVIIVAVFGIAMMIYANVMQSGLSVKKIRARALLDEAATNISPSQSDLNKSFSAGDFSISQTVKAYNGESDLLEIDLTAYDINQQKVAELHKIIINDDQ